MLYFVPKGPRLRVGGKAQRGSADTGLSWPLTRHWATAVNWPEVSFTGTSSEWWARDYRLPGSNSSTVAERVSVSRPGHLHKASLS